MNEQIKNRVIEAFKVVWQSQKMVDHCVKSTVNAVILKDNKVITLAKPHLQTSFCYGYGWCGISTEEEQRDASNMALQAEKDASIFIEENRKKKLEKFNNYVVFKKYFGPGEVMGYMDAELYDLEMARVRHGDFSPYSSYEDVRRLDDEEAEALNKEIDSFNETLEKRIQTYIKRYGTSKLRTWSFLVD